MIRWFESRPKISWTLIILIAIGIFYISSLTFPAGVSASNFKPIVYHISAFFLLSLFLAIALTKGEKNYFIILAVAIAIIYAFTDELHQSLVPGRSSSFSDIMLDNVGITFSLLIYLISLELRK